MVASPIDIRFTPQKQTLLSAMAMSALCQKRAHAAQQFSSLCVFEVYALLDPNTFDSLIFVLAFTT